MNSSTTSDGARARDEQILSAKKKLKSFRAKQAQMARAKSASTSTSAKAGVVDVAGPLMAELDMQSTENTRRHSRTASRSGHGRGHSRAGSISITPQALASQVVASSIASTSARPFSAHTASGGHLRTHSRSGSRSSVNRPRPSSLLLGGRKEEPIVLAVEHPAGVSPLGEWRDVPSADSVTQSFVKTAAGQPEQNTFADVSSLFPRSPGTAAEQVSGSASSSVTHTPVQERRQSRHARRTSVATKRESMEIMGGIGLGMTASSTFDSLASSRRRSSRMSGLPSASVLFGVPDAKQHLWDWKSAFASNGPEEQEGEEGRLTALEKLEGRVPPAAAAPATAADTPSTVSSRSQSRQSRRISGHQRQSSVQLPSFDDMHGSEGMDRRASSQLLEKNEKTTSEISSSGPRDSWHGSLNPPKSSSSSCGNANPPKSPTSPLMLVTSKRPDSMIIHSEASQPEGLGTLMEEEEEEESLSPVRERQSMDTPLSGSSSSDEMRRQRRLAEEETIKRNRRASLTPRPLKLKSRPPSLYLAPSLGGGMSTSQSLPILSHSNPVSPNTSTFDADKTPRLETDAALTSEPPTPTFDSPRVTDSPVVVKSWSLANAQQRLADWGASTAPRGDATPTSVASQPESLRAHRASPAFSPPMANGFNAAPPAPRERPGMRTLRLGGHQSSLTSLSSVAESSSSTDSLSSSMIASNRRRSIVRAESDSVTLTQEELGNGLPSHVTPRSARRSSIHYKPSGQHGPTSSISGHGATPSLASLGGVPLAVHDELKAKASRDAALLESTKEQLECVQRELVLETQRNSRELAELQHASAEEQAALSSRLRGLEDAASEAAQKIAELEKDLRTSSESIADLEAERDVLSDDVEGWRSRCQDAEKSLRSERFKLGDQRKLKNAAKLRIQQLTAILEHHDIAIPTDEINVVQALDEAQLDIASAVRSPALGSSSPVVGGGYFSLAAADPPPMTIKLLGDMRQQIINLAGSLEHERAEHLKAKDELARLQEEQLHRSQSWTSTSFTTTDIADESRESKGEPHFSDPPPERRRTGSGASVVGKFKRHVFAYDSSMGSFGQSTTSLGSASMSMMTDEPTTDDDESSHSPPRSKAPGLEGEAVGLGMGALQTLDEIEEVSESGAEDSSTIAMSEDDCQPVEMETDASSADLEAGGIDARPSIDVSESSFGDRQFEDAHSPRPLHSEKFSSPMQSPNASALAAAGVHGSPTSHGFRSTGSSLESNEGPATPPLDHHQSSFHGGAGAGGDDASTVSSRCPSPRPEFIPDWNFDMAIRRGRFSRSKNEDAAIEDFFGIMQEGSLPPLTTSEEPIDMPPIRLNARGEAAIVPRNAARVASATGGRRPPVARSAYTRESFSESGGSPRYGSFQARGENNSFSTTSSAAAFGSRALSRMSLQGLTSAFTGLSSYLTNQSGATVTAAAAATKMCGPGEMPFESDSVHASLSWTAERRALDDEDDGEVHSAGPRSAGTPQAREMVSSHPASWSAASSSGQGQMRKGGGPRAFVEPATIPPPMATPVWQLDFTRSSSGGPVFAL